jgi:hypothetical protein
MALLPFAHGVLQAELAINNNVVLIDNTAILVDNRTTLVDNSTILVDNTAILVDNGVMLADNKATLADIHEKVSAMQGDSHPQRRTVSGFLHINGRILTIP